MHKWIKILFVHQDEIPANHNVSEMEMRLPIELENEKKTERLKYLD